MNKSKQNTLLIAGLIPLLSSSQVISEPEFSCNRVSTWATVKNHPIWEPFKTNCESEYEGVKGKVVPSSRFSKEGNQLYRCDLNWGPDETQWIVYLYHRVIAGDPSFADQHFEDIEYIYATEKECLEGTVQPVPGSNWKADFGSFSIAEAASTYLNSLLSHRNNCGLHVSY